MVLLLVLGVPILLLLGFVMLSQYCGGSGHLVLVAPEDGELVYTLDGHAPVKIAAGGHERVVAAQGKHTLHFESPRGVNDRIADVKNGFQDLLVPLDDEQCFVLVDVSRSHYKYEGKNADPLPRVKDRVRPRDSFDVPSATYFSEKELPSSVTEGHSCNLLVPSPCDKLALGDTELLHALELAEE